LDPALKKGDWTTDEDLTLINAQAMYGNQWTKIAGAVVGRSENSAKNRWNSAPIRRMKKKMTDDGTDPELTVEKRPRSPRAGKKKAGASYADERHDGGGGAGAEGRKRGRATPTSATTAGAGQERRSKPRNCGWRSPSPWTAPCSRARL